MKLEVNEEGILTNEEELYKMSNDSMQAVAYQLMKTVVKKNTFIKNKLSTSNKYKIFYTAQELVMYMLMHNDPDKVMEQLKFAEVEEAKVLEAIELLTKAFNF